MKRRVLKTVVLASVMLVACSGYAFAQTDSLVLEKNVFAPGEEIVVKFTASGAYPENAWVGIIPSNVPHGDEAVNDQHDLTYQYLIKRTSGTLVFTAPGSSGNYDLRMHSTDNNGKETASVTFTVKIAKEPASLTLEKTKFAPGEEIVVKFTASPSYPENAWVGIIPASVPHGSEAVNDQHDITYQYLKKRTSGTLVFTAPTAPGSYDLRMHDTDNNGVEVFSVTFTVK